MSSDHPYRADLVNAFIAATDEAFQVVCGLRSTFTKATLKTKGLHPVGEDWVSGFIGLGGTLFNGNMVLDLPSDLACGIAGRMIGEAIPGVNDSVLDGVGEMTNIIAGGAKNRLVAQGMNLNIGLPRVVHGSDFQTVELHDAPCLAFEFATGPATFHLEVCLIRRAAPKA